MARPVSGTTEARIDFWGDVGGDSACPVYLLGGYNVISATYKDREKIAERFRAGEGFGWHEHDPELLGTELFFRPGYRAHLISEWIPTLEGVDEKLRSGAKVADIGLRARDLDRADGEGVPGIDDPRLRLSRGGRRRSPRPGV